MRTICSLLLLGMWLVLPAAADEKKPDSRFPISKETTFFTGPLDDEGYIDFEAALNERLGKGVTPEKNANVLLWQAFGPKPEGGTGMPPEFFKSLGINEPPERGDYLLSLGNYLKDHAKLDQAGWNAIFEQQTRAGQRPWVEKDSPHIAAWLKANEKPLALVVEASKRPEYFNPLWSRRTEGKAGGLIGALLPGVQKCRELASLLTVRAMLRTSEGKFDEAWQDLMACHRLGRHLSRGATLIEALVGVAIDAVASNAELAYLERAPLTSKQVMERLKDLQGLPPMSPMADKIDLGERTFYLDSLQHIRRGNFGLDGLANGQNKKPTAEELQALDRIDWEPALRNGNQWYDRMAAALRVKDRAGREKELDKIEEELKALQKANAGLGNIGQLLQDKDKTAKAVGKAIGDVLIGLLIPAVRKVQGAFDRAEQTQRNLHLAFALAAFRLDTGRYPAKLEELAPKYLAAVPGDVFSGGALVYRPMDKGYLLYSVGANGKDEEGRWYDDDPRGDDPRVRMPLPELKPR
jgi:hypothetical protein